MISYVHPRRNADLFGHTQAEHILRGAASGGHLHHAWLLVGAAGIGKMTLAYRFARALLASFPSRLLEVPKSHRVFTQIASGVHPDLLILSPADGQEKSARTEISVDEVRNVVAAFALTVSTGGWRVVIVDGADFLGKNAANAILKILEEPPSRTIFIATSESPAGVPATIRSRCIVVRLRSLNDREMFHTLERLMIDIDPDILTAAVGDGNGSPLRAIRFIERQASNEAANFAATEPLTDAQTDVRGIIRKLVSEPDCAESHAREAIHTKYDAYCDTLKLRRRAARFNLDPLQVELETAGISRR